MRRVRRRRGYTTICSQLACAPDLVDLDDGVRQCTAHGVVFLPPLETRSAS